MKAYYYTYFVEGCRIIQGDVLIEGNALNEAGQYGGILPEYCELL